MREFLRMTQAEFLKLRRTKILLMCVGLPIVSVLLFSAYFRTHSFGSAEEWAGYAQALAAALPAVTGILCAMSVSMEEKSHFALLLGTAIFKHNALLSKWAALSVLELLALLLAIGGFLAAGGYLGTEGEIRGGNLPRAGEVCFGGNLHQAGEKHFGGNLHQAGGFGDREFFLLAVCIVLVLWLCIQAVCLLQLLFSLFWTGNAAICAGIFQTLTAALFLTGLGDGIWPFVPCAYGGRWASYVIRSFAERGKLLILRESAGYAAVNLLVTTGVAAAVLAGFHYFEGREICD